MLEKYKLLIDEDEALLLQGLVEKVMQYEAKDVNVDYLLAKLIVASNSFGNVDVGSVKDVYEKLQGGA
tara:strand:+ start:6213 stop:6416 length:204 start_codon:yes stop_codon:yes gene_type:complete